ncbi:MFS transporter [Nocardioidaceae bacterium]|nr:MFS transporter [Nocardioidaceae bacterium]
MDRNSIKVGVGGAAVVGVAFGMARYAYGLTLPDLREEFDLSEVLLGLIASGTFVGYLLGLLAVPPLAHRRGPRAPTTIGAGCAVLGCATVATAPNGLVLGVGAVLSGAAAGWVWAPYSDIVTSSTPRRDQNTLLAVITTGTSAGLLLVAGLGLVGAATSWRATWAGIAVAAFVGALVNLRLVPRLKPGDPWPASAPQDLVDAGAESGSRAPVRTRDVVRRRGLIAPLAFSAAFFTAVTVYLTYAADAARQGGLAAVAAPILFALVGLGGLVALLTARLTGRLGTGRVGSLSLSLSGVALLALSWGGDSLVAVLGGAVVFGISLMVGSSVLSVWTAEASPDVPEESFTTALVVGAIVSIASPTVAGAALGPLGLPMVLALTGVAALLVAAGLEGAAHQRRRAHT